MRRRTALLLATVTIAAWLTAQHVAGQPQQAERAWSAPPTVVAFAGSYSGVTSREYHRITNEVDWRELWARHAGDNTERDSYGEIVAPGIDFDKFVAVAIFNGDGWNTRSMSLVESSQGDDWRIRFDANTYQTSAASVTEIVIEGEMTDEKLEEAILREAQSKHAERDAGKFKDPNYTSAYGIFVLPRSDKPIVLFENVQGLKDEAPTWNEVHRFE
jgi:hypothetical protein